MESPPTDPRVTAMLATLFGPEWDKLDGPIAFEKSPVDSWVYAAEAMLAAADAVDPIRVAIRGLVAGGDDEARSGNLPDRTNS